ncbi:DUF305 domain-containing protein [Rufibacter soli]
MESSHYKKFFLMLLISFVIMYAVMFLNVDKLEHVYLSTTRLYMTLLMVAPMAFFMLLMMSNMYQDKKLNSLILAGSVLVFAVVLYLLRSQIFIGDVQYMKAMIPHHSSAIMVSQKANLQDPEVRKLADQIIKSQKEEIAQMKAALARLQK